MFEFDEDVIDELIEYDIDELKSTSVSVDVVELRDELNDLSASFLGSFVGGSSSDSSFCGIGKSNDMLPEKFCCLNG